MRIVAGKFRGRRLRSPKGRSIRPTTDRVREAVFSIIGSRARDCRVLDLFAGSGALGLEALSRGAGKAVFIDSGIEAIRLIRENISLCGASDTAEAIHGSVEQAIRRLAHRGETFHLIFMDPPYGKGCVDDTLAVVDCVAAEEVLIVAEHHLKDVVPSHVGFWRKTDERRYGDTVISFFERDGLPEPAADRL